MSRFFLLVEMGAMLLAFFASQNLLVAQSPPDHIPFTLNSHHNSCILASINGADSLLLMFHSASTGVTLRKEAVAKLANISTRSFKKETGIALSDDITFLPKKNKIGGLLKNPDFSSGKK